MNRLQEQYKKDVAPALLKSFDFKNVMQIPRIEKVVVNIGLGVFIFKDDYGSLDASDFVSSTPSSGRLISWSSNSSLGNAVSDADMVNALQTKVGSSRFKLRLQFNKQTDNDNGNDYLTFNTVILKVTYYTP